AFYVHLGPNNKICEEGRFPKITEIKLGFSRDGFHWQRPDRRAFLPASRDEEAWDRAYIHSTGGVFYLDGDRLVFPYCGFSGVAPDGRRGMYMGASVGLATLRRDGFASMDAGESVGTLTTRTLEFDGQFLFVNVDCPDGELRAELLDGKGQVMKPYTLENCEPVQADGTLAGLKWKGAPVV
ncbi:MAG: glycosyl hydrolase family 32, partial [bacterium]|nr:glycosyl hydrolase family 32 [bacterium]